MKKAFKAFRIRHVVYALILVAIVVGAKNYWANKHPLKESPTLEETTTLPLQDSTPNQQDEISNTKDEDEDEDEEENEDDDPIADNTSPWTVLKTALPQRYYESPAIHKHPQVAIILTDLGLNKTWTDQIIASVNKNITLAYSPYSPNLKEQLQQAIDLGFQTLVSIPMEPYDYPNTDPGSYTLLTGVNVEENIQKLKELMEIIPSGSGLIGKYGARFAASANDLEPILKIIKESGRLFVDHNPTPHSQIHIICKALDMPRLQIDLTIPIHSNLEDKEDFAKIMVQNAKENGMIVLSVPAIPAYMNQLQEWLGTLGKNDIKLVTIAELHRQQIAQVSSLGHQGTTNVNQQDAHQPR